MTEDGGTEGREIGPRSSFTTAYREATRPSTLVVQFDDQTGSPQLFPMPIAGCRLPLSYGTHLLRFRPTGGAR